MPPIPFTTLEQFIIEEGAHRPSETGSFSRLLRDISIAGKGINCMLQEAALIGVLGTSNKSNFSGDVQKRMDLHAHNELIRCLQRGGECQIVGSEEALTLISLEGDHIAGRYTVLLDPMDGSDNIDVAAPVGTIFSIFQDEPGTRPGRPLRIQNGSTQVAAGYLVYGSSAMFVYTSGSGVNGFTLDPEIGEFILSHPDIKFPQSPKFYSRALAAAGACGAAVASVHPLKTFAEPREAVRTFAGTYCVMEGERAALDVLAPAFERIGGRMSQIDPQFKTVYHAASVIVCNGLTALMESGLRCYEQAGFERETAVAMMEPIVRETLDNVFKLGTARALTGPIARADSAVVEKHLQALAVVDPRLAAVYRELGLVALELARAQRAAGDAGLEALCELLTRVQPGGT